MAARLVPDARQTTRSVFLVNERSRMTRSTQKGMYLKHSNDPASMLIHLRYVEMLEQQQSQLVAGLQETYRRLFGAQLWPGARLAEHNGKPLTHDILAGLNLLEMKQDGSGEMEMFEEDCQKLQQRLVLDGAPYVGRRGSFSSESDHDSTFHQSHARTSSHSSLHGTPISSHAQPVFNENWNFQSSPSPITLSPPPKMRLAQQGLKPSPLSHSSGPTSDDNYIMPSWRNSTGNINMASNYVHPQFTFQAPAVQDNLQTIMENYSQSVELAMDSDMAPLDFSQQFANGATAFGTFNPQDWMINESMEVDFSKFVQVST